MGSAATPTDYQATYRATQIALPGLIGVVMFIIGGVAATLNYLEGDALLTAMLTVLGGAVAATLLIVLGCVRVHRWIVGADGVVIHERPKVPLAGPSRRLTLPYADIAGLAMVESGLDHLLRIDAADGRRFVMPRATMAGKGGIPRPVEGEDLAALADAIRAAARRAGRPLRETGQGLSFWNGIPGIVCLILMFLFALAIAAAAGFALLDGGLPSQSRAGQTVAIALALPLGAGYILVKALRRRRAVLAANRDGA